MRIAIVGTLVGVFAVSLAAQEQCLVTETPPQCAQRLAVDRAAAAVQAATAAAPAGVNTITSPARSALKDFLTVASAHLATSTLTEGTDESLSLAYNLPVLGGNRQLRFETLLTKPRLSPAVQSAAGVQAPTLRDSLSAADDVLFDLSFTSANRRFGRKIAPHRALLESLLPPDAAPVTPEVQKSLDAVSTLLHNQPQLFASANYHLRKDLVGVRAWSGALTWELGTRNLRSFYAHEGRDCEQTRTCAAALETYLRRTAHSRLPGRLALSIEYDRTLGSRPRIPDAELSSLFVTPTQSGLSYSAVYGQPFASLLSGKEGRLDLTVTYDGKSVEHHVGTSATPPLSLRTNATDARVTLQSVAPPRDRSTIALTYTQQLSDRVSVPLTLFRSDGTVTTPGACVALIISPNQLVCQPAVTTSRHRTGVQVGVLYRIPPPGAPRPRECCCR